MSASRNFLGASLLVVLLALGLPGLANAKTLLEPKLDSSLGRNGDLHANNRNLIQPPVVPRASSGFEGPDESVFETVYSCTADRQVGGAVEREVAEGCEEYCPDGSRRLDTYELVNGSPVRVAGGCESSRVQQIGAAVEEIFRKQVVVPAPSRQPGSNPVLVQWPVVYYSDFVQHDISTTLLGDSVTLRVVPAQYLWAFGDGETDKSKTAGKPVDTERYTTPEEIEEEAVISHKYQRCGTVNATLTVTFSGQFSINGGPFQTMPGQAVVTSASAPITLKEARAQLVDPNAPMPTNTPPPCRHNY